ncbi:Spermidine/putrescine ABC transporter ATP-binding subunit [Trichormus variabilis ATCC 29413]|uniref:Spermidine/putrescine import ATP-binding protein PotA n=2 Tax=Anabaena variabilis TaxID=264691 RepID=POTA_TRIV2|nr:MULTISPECIES: ABC transporter ATP-binding protein [Nostocaceae]Q3MAR5.1 RecName: Full=Spermidine/putrescine import ATP-binding protein PotA [Trichormus variabilis ATCC 29413]ABA21921.1 Spermidine/putrescine ABC transporter ATP-binding subunit [Trichormus variabilis ATCC 29413]MBC1213382.1 ABC transporter ATP-binding protein [Trichormus variabilis ARAD]MBC1255963.1 ABC transporter ATP-binding protein [Trichormus variabilis V5]MBC1269059.1 ABC transporter ATP-binding protein [Trichormus varia
MNMAQTVTQNPRGVKTLLPLDVELRNVFKFFNQEPAVHGVDLDVKQGEFFSILGPSGCGKTTTLRLIAGFEQVDAGKLLIQGQPMTNIPPYRRPVNTVFQSYALFNHLNVWDNVAFGLRLKKSRKSEVESRVKEALKLVKMESLRSRFPSQLSGGQQQRVALARALVNRPAVVLLDEPLGALDLKLRKEMQVELSNLHKNLGLTFIMVTHDQEEALSLSDRIAVMNQGKIEQIGTPQEIYERPKTSFVADFIGDTNLFSGEITVLEAEYIQIVTKTGLTIVVARNEDTPAELLKSVVVSVRPEKIQLSLYPPSSLNNCFEGRLINVMYLGTHVNYLVQLINGININVLQPNTFGNLPDRETPIYAWWAESDCLAINQMTND